MGGGEGGMYRGGEDWGVGLGDMEKGGLKPESKKEGVFCYNLIFLCNGCYGVAMGGQLLREALWLPGRC